MTFAAPTCPDDGLWRTWLDGEAGEQGSLFSQHLAACPTCRRTVDELRQTSAAVGSALDALAPARLPSPAETALARKRLDRVRTGPQLAPQPVAPQPTTREALRPMPSTHLFARWRIAVSALAAALALVFVVATPQGQVAAAQFLAQFRSQRFTAITIDPNTLANPLSSLADIGRVTPERPSHDSKTVASLAEASTLVGFPVRGLDASALPAGVNGSPRITVTPAQTFRFTFDKAKAQSALTRDGQPNVVLPDRFDGASIVVAVPAAALVEYRAADGSPALVFGQAQEFTVGTEGSVSLDEMRDFLLNLPGLPADTVRQLRNIQDWRNTVPLPIPADSVLWRDATVNGTPALVLSDNSGLGSGAIWQTGGRIYGLAGPLKSDDLLRVASSIR